MTTLTDKIALLKRFYDWVVSKISGLPSNGEWWIQLPDGSRKRVE